jgi:hypothetical protein
MKLLPLIVSHVVLGELQHKVALVARIVWQEHLLRTLVVMIFAHAVL